MKLIIKLLLNAIIVFVIANLLRGYGVTLDNYWTAIIVAVVLSVLNLLVKPILVIFTLPITIVTLGLFLIVINAIILEITASLVNGFGIDSFWTAIFFSLLLSILQSILHSTLKEEDRKSN